MRNIVRRLTSRKWLMILSVAAIIVAIAAIALIRNTGGETQDNEHGDGVPVVVGSPERRTVEEVLRYPGTLVPVSSITIVSKVPGRVVTIHVAEGDRVEPGMLLVTLDAESVRLQADQAYAAWQAAEAQQRKAERGVRNEELENTRALVAQAEEEVEVANRNFERSKRLFEAGTISRSKYEEAESAIRGATTSLENAKRSLAMMEEGATSEDIDSARSQAEALKAQYDLAALQLKDARVTANSHGTVGKILVESGNTVGAGTPLMALVTEDPINAKISVPEKHYARFTDAEGNMRVRLYPTAFDSAEPSIGTIQEVAPIIDAQSRTFIVEATVPNPEGKLRPGMYVNATIIVDSREAALSVPESALVNRDDVLAVFIVKTGNSEHAMVQPVEVGIRTDGMVEIVGGIDDDTRVIIEGNAFLEDGQLVRIIETR